jgi:hypothetical protein
MDRRVFLKLTGVAAAASAWEGLAIVAAGRPPGLLAGQAYAHELASVSSATRLTVQEPGTYRIVGRVQLQEPLVEISGITHKQWISWSGADGPQPPVVGFTTFERFDRPGMTPEIHVRGGRLEALTILPVDLE